MALSVNNLNISLPPTLLLFRDCFYVGVQEMTSQTNQIQTQTDRDTLLNAHTKADQSGLQGRLRSCL